MAKKDGGGLSQVRMIGCCGAYCRTCSPFQDGSCKGCKLGYDDGKRDIRAARCKIKLCCFGSKNLETCADCLDYPGCATIHELYGKKGYKYGKYRQSVEFIRQLGYPEFLKRAGLWRCAYGRLEP